MKQSMHSVDFILQFLYLMPYKYLQCLLKGLKIQMPIHVALYLSLLL